MTSILVVCSGNICRSPIAEGFLRAALLARFGDAAPTVSSAGTMGLEGSAATPEAVEAALERGSDISGHRARRLTAPMVSSADLLLCMATDHRKLLARSSSQLVSRAFTMKELVRLLETLPTPEPHAHPSTLASRIAAADEARRAGAVLVSRDEDVADPLGQPFEAYRGTAWELETWLERLVIGLYGPAAAAEAAAGGT
jgi:protein-tyrosine phosphatase